MTKKKSTAKIAKKKLAIADLFAHCKANNDYTFHNRLVKEFAGRHGFGNQFDVTKADQLALLPQHVRDEGYCIIHLGKGYHRFVRAIEHCFHDFEEITDPEIPWEYKKSLLNETDSSESNVLSVSFNQRIIHHFLYGEVNLDAVQPNMYGSRRTQISAEYRIFREEVSVNGVQIEIDLVTEHHGVVTAFECKNGFPKNFAVYQLYHPFLYFTQFQQRGEIDISRVNCCYMLRKVVDGESVVRVYLYNFTDAADLASLQLEKSAQYRLIQR